MALCPIKNEHREMGKPRPPTRQLLNKIKKRLEKAKGKWVKELLNVLWAYRTMPQKVTNKTLYTLTFRFKIVIPLEVSLPII